jgi:hypothetical protein
MYIYIYIAFHGFVSWSDDRRMWNKSKSHNTYANEDINTYNSRLLQRFTQKKH